MGKTSCYKAVILIGGPGKGTRFRPLSLDTPKPLFPVAGSAMVHHLLEACTKVPGLVEILLIGGYQPSEEFTRFMEEAKHLHKVPIRYYQEFAPLGTGGGIYHFRDQILSGGPEAFFVLNCDVCGDFPLVEMLEQHQSLQAGDSHLIRDIHTMLSTEATRQQSLNYGCIVTDKEGQIQHFVDKPETYLSTHVNCGVYLFSIHIFQRLAEAYRTKMENVGVVDPTNGYDATLAPTYKDESISLEKEVFPQLAASGKFYSYSTTRFWSQIKSPSSTIYANRHYLNSYRKHHPERLAVGGPTGPTIIGDVYAHPTASISPSAVLGPNVSVGKGVVIGEGVRIRESIVLAGAQIQDHSCVLHSIVGWESLIGSYVRVEGTPHDPNPNKPFSKLDIQSLFSEEGRLNPSITVIGSRVQVSSEQLVLNSVVLPHKEIRSPIKNLIVL